MATRSSDAPPKWRCNDCGKVFDTGGAHPGLEHVDDKADVLSRHGGGPRNICPECGGLLHPLEP